MMLKIPPLEITAATLLERVFVGVVQIPTFLPMSAMTLLMVGLRVILITTTASIVQTAKIRLPASHAM